MQVIVTIEQVAALAPAILPAYRDAFREGQAVLDEYAISASALRVAHFMAQTLHESAGYTRQFENLQYGPARLALVWPQRFLPLGPLDPAQYAQDPEQLANAVYGGRMGNAAPGDGYAYRGRGLLQLTGRDNYAAATLQVRRYRPDCPDFVLEPDAVADAAWCLRVAAAAWEAKGCNRLADLDDPSAIGARINGGGTGLAERLEWTRRTRLVWRAGPGAG